jgi:hypothetical protein
VLDRAVLENVGSKIPVAPAVTFQLKARELDSILSSMAYATDKLQSDGCTANLLIPLITTAFRSKLSYSDLNYY